jgi:hypothetical protein
MGYVILHCSGKFVESFTDSGEKYADNLDRALVFENLEQAFYALCNVRGVTTAYNNYRIYSLEVIKNAK